MRILYTPCPLMKPDLRLRLYATQAQPCFPAASNALALPGGNGIFTATPAERITHYTLLCKVVCRMGALPPLETPTRKGGTLPPPRGVYRLFLLSSPPAVSVEQKSAWDWCGIFNFGKVLSPSLILSDALHENVLRIPLASICDFCGFLR